ncbi:hypothetical protein Bbelb_041110 [Branchiostoma belcheri]|nr:hypothetical protein Bbelb_041110 [Branchiostoma belcheri]
MTTTSTGMIRVSSPDVPVQTRLDETADFEVDDRVKNVNPEAGLQQEEEPDFCRQGCVKEDGYVTGPSETHTGKSFWNRQVHRIADSYSRKLTRNTDGSHSMYTGTWSGTVSASYKF